MKVEKKKEIIRMVKFFLFSVSAGVIEMVAFALLNELTKWAYWPCYLIALTLSVLWNFTLNRNFTFQSASNVPVAMIKIAIFYCIFTPVTALLGNYLAEDLQWNEYLVTAINMVLNLTTEYLYDRFFVFGKTIDTNDRVDRNHINENREERKVKNCGISRWDDPTKINVKLEKLTSQEIWEVDDNYYDSVVMKYFDEKCKASKAVYEESQTYIPGGVQHNLAFNKPFPMCMSKAEGAYLYDKDGNQYIDFLQAGGPTILGSNYPAVREKVIELLNECGPVTGLLHEAELLIAREINRHMPNVEMFRMLGSGTEAVMASLRIARIATGNKHVIKVGGAYHGWSDQMVYGLKIPGSRALLESHGIPSGAYRYTDEVRPNDLHMLEKMLKRNRLTGGTAAVLLEPVGPESGTRPVAKDYNKGVRALCDKYGALLIFDEVVTGFRVALGGAQGYFNVVPDLTIFGKVVAGGYPAAGGVGGKKEYAQLMAAGLATGKHRAYVGGTLAANPLSCLAGYTAIQEIEKTNACEIAGRMGDRLCDGLEGLIDRYGLPFVAYNQGSIVHLECTGAMSFDFSSMSFIKSALGLLKHKKMMYVRKDSMEKMGAAYMANGIVTLAGSRLYTSLADTPEVIDEALNKFEEVFKHVKKTDKGLI